MKKNPLCAKVLIDYTKCIDCNICISACNLTRSISKKGKNPEIDNDSCDRCGFCLAACPHDALYYTDDTQAFLSGLKNGEQIVLAVDPAFYVAHQKDAGIILGYLKKLGAADIYNVGFGYDLSLWAHLHWLQNHHDSPAIVSHCFTILEYLEKYEPKLLPFVSPAMSGVLCLAKYLRRYKNESRKIAYISPCIAAKDFMCHKGTENLVAYNVTFKYLRHELASEIKNERQNLQPAAVQPDDFTFGNMVPFAHSLKDILTHFVAGSRTVIDFPEFMHSAKDISAAFVSGGNRKNFVLTTESCAKGCACGTGTDKASLSDADIFACRDESSQKLNDKSFSLADLDKRFEALDINDFYMTYVECFEEHNTVPEAVIQEIFSVMEKTTEEARHINCRYCGYATCREMANHIAIGENSIENCIFHKMKTYRKFLTTDRITGLQNIHSLLDCIQKMITDKNLAGYSVIKMHINDLILINDTHGYAEGTKLLFDFSQKAAAVLQGRGQIFHGHGATFFAIVKNESVNNFIFRINHFEFNFSLDDNDGEKYTTSLRCGVYKLTGDEQDTGDVFNPLSAAYRNTKISKNANVVFYDSNIRNNMMRSIRISQNIPVAFRNKEFSIVLQPKVSVKDKILVGAEALIRWSHNGKIINPANFINIAETNGFIKQIDFFMLAEVCKYLSTWKDIGVENVRISVNFSKTSFTRKGFAERVCDVIDRYNVPHECIEIEITESSFADDLEKIVLEINSLHGKGIHVSVDDFGTGYSSISLLQNLDFDVVKFDKTIVDTVVPGTRAESVMKNMIKMAKDLNMRVVAEGVDTHERLSLLENLGCDIIQGYIFDKPLQPPDFLKRLLNKQYRI